MWIDDLIGIFSPKSAYLRKQARIALDILERGYEGAKTGRRIDDWITTGASANAEIGKSAALLRERARDLVRNNCFGSRAPEIITGNAIGTGITPQARTKSDKLNERIMEAWEAWCAECDADGHLDYYGIQALVARSMYESGECFIRFRDRSLSDGLHVPFQLQVLEADHLDTTRSGKLPNGNIINNGIEFDSINRRVAFWMWPQHPGENIIGSYKQQSVRVPADQIIHIFRKLRPGQIRGASAFAPAMVKMRDLDGYDDAELWRKKIEACFAAFVVQNSGSDGPIVGNVLKKSGNSTDENGKQKEPEKIEEFRPGMVEYLQPGEDVRFGSPTSDSNYESYVRVQLHAIAAGLGITYEQLTGDLSQVNYSSLRAGLLEFRRWIEILRWHVFIPMFCNQVWRRFIDRAYVAGVINRQDYGVVWSAPKFEMIDPLKDAQADTLMMRNGTLTLREAIARQGFDPEKQIQEIAEIFQKLDDLKIILDIDPRKTAKSGASNETQQGGNNAPASNSGENNAADKPDDEPI